MDPLGILMDWLCNFGIVSHFHCHVTTIWVFTLQEISDFFALK